MGLYSGDLLMPGFYRCEKAQSLVELALVMMLFYLFAIGLIQLIMIGQSWIKLQTVARRTAWHGHYYNNQFTNYFRSKRFGTINYQLQQIAKGLEFELPDDYFAGSQKDGFAYEITARVKAIGYFQLAWPDGFHLSTTAAVIASPFIHRLGRPMVDRRLHQGGKIDDDLFQNILSRLEININHSPLLSTE